MVNSGAKSAESRSKQLIAWRLTSGEFSDDRSVFVEQRDSSIVGN